MSIRFSLSFLLVLVGEAVENFCDADQDIHVSLLQIAKAKIGSAVGSDSQKFEMCIGPFWDPNGWCKWIPFAGCSYTPYCQWISGPSWAPTSASWSCQGGPSWCAAIDPVGCSYVSGCKLGPGQWNPPDVAAPRASGICYGGPDWCKYLPLAGCMSVSGCTWSSSDTRSAAAASCIGPMGDPSGWCKSLPFVSCYYVPECTWMAYATPGALPPPHLTLLAANLTMPGNFTLQHAFLDTLVGKQHFLGSLQPNATDAAGPTGPTESVVSWSQGLCIGPNQDPAGWCSNLPSIACFNTPLCNWQPQGPGQVPAQPFLGQCQGGPSWCIYINSITGCSFTPGCNWVTLPTSSLKSR